MKNKSIELKKCKKCSRVLPKDYKYNKCEHCRGKTAERVKKRVLGVGGTIMTIGLVITHGKFWKNKS